MKDQSVNCPICDGVLVVPAGTEESEILACGECNNRVVVSSIEGGKVMLEEAPVIEEDWGQ